MIDFEKYKEYLEQFGYKKIIYCKDCRYQKTADQFVDGEGKTLKWCGKDFDSRLGFDYQYCSEAKRK